MKSPVLIPGQVRMQTQASNQGALGTTVSLVKSEGVKFREIYCLNWLDFRTLQRSYLTGSWYCSMVSKALSSSFHFFVVIRFCLPRMDSSRSMFVSQIWLLINNSIEFCWRECSLAV